MERDLHIFRDQDDFVQYLQYRSYHLGYILEISYIMIKGNLRHVKCTLQLKATETCIVQRNLELRLLAIIELSTCV